ncbi:hypothetical protein C8F01DRAFT_1082355 [Mycena amicta]|nr:hypothetical protein C8F01DRAFT_1082355 [Mycena amicta]
MSAIAHPMNPPTAEPRPRRVQPFPEIPAGVTIVPFKDFVECGIRVPALVDSEWSETQQHDVERDGLGMPTIPLRAKHDTDVSKTIPNKKRTPREWAASRPTFRKEWWQDWTDGEDLRNHGPYNPNDPTIDRFHQAASDFQKYRKFPPYSTKVQYMWEQSSSNIFQFKIFSGLLGTTPVWHNVSEKPLGENSDDDVESDFEDEQPKRQNQNGPGGDKRFPPRPRPRAPYELFGKRPTIVHDNDEIKALLDAARAQKDQRARTFLEDPGKHIQVFLSSYMRNEGLAWEDRHLDNAPHLLRFVVDYLLRNNVFAPEPEAHRSLRECLPVIDKAITELPLTAQLAKVFPDDFSLACRDLWGRKSIVVVAELMLPTIDRITLDGEDEVPKEGEIDANDNDNDPSAFTPLPNDDWAADSASATDADPNATWVAHAAPVASLFARLGPTALPLTHEPGVVELSQWRTLQDLGLWGVVLEPWIGWAGDENESENQHNSDYARPSLLGSPFTPAATMHDPLKSRITLLVNTSVRRKLLVGMGLGGTWVQLARVADEGAQGEEALWYCDDLNMVLPSYWIPGV